MSISKDIFLVFSDDWGEHPSSCQHIFKHIVRKYPVIWVNNLGMRTPKFNKVDALKAIKKLKKMFFSAFKKNAAQIVLQKMTVLQPFMIPYNYPLFRKFNQKSVSKTVKETLKKLNFSSPILVTTVPNVCDYIGVFKEKKIVYYCVDDFAEWPGHEKKLILQMEEDLIQKVDIFIATSDKLYQRLKKYGKSTFLLTHGVDLQAFTTISDDAEHATLGQIPRPRVGYVGLIDARLDWSLIEALLKDLPEVNFVFVGKKEFDLSFLERYSNFYRVSPVPYSEVPLVLKSMDILILPYLVNEFTQTINPLKLKEYLTSGRSIIGVPLKEIQKYEAYLEIGFTRRDWGDKIKKALQEKPSLANQGLREFLKEEDWSVKAQNFLSICLE